MIDFVSLVYLLGSSVFYSFSRKSELPFFRIVLVIVIRANYLYTDKKLVYVRV